MRECFIHFWRNVEGQEFFGGKTFERLPNRVRDLVLLYRIRIIPK